MAAPGARKRWHRPCGRSASRPRHWSSIVRLRGRPQALAPVVAAGVPRVLVHNAGVHDDVPLAGISETQWRSVIDVSLDGFFAVLRPHPAHDRHALGPRGRRLHRSRR